MKQILEKIKSLTVLPKVISEALKEYGTLETAGTKDNPKIIGWAKEVGGDVGWYDKDSIPWCGLFTAVVVKRAGKEGVKESLRALSWANYGEAVDKKNAMLGDVLVFKRTGGGHVGFYVGESEDSFFVLGGNQSDKVCITRISKDRIFAVRRTKYNAIPETVKKYYFDNDGDLSQNEA